MIAILVLILTVLMGGANQSAPVVIPPMPQHSPVVAEELEWSEYHADATKEYADEFTALFNSYEVKHARNGALMIRRGNTGSFRFAKKG